MSRKLSDAQKKRIAGNQRFKCNNKPGSNLVGMDDYDCPLWAAVGDHTGCFDKSGYEIDHITEWVLTNDDSTKNLQALCPACHRVKTSTFMMNRSTKQPNMKHSKINKIMANAHDTDKYINNECDTYERDTYGCDTYERDTYGCDTYERDTDGCDTDGCDTDGCDTDGCDTDGCDTDGCDTDGCDTDGCDTDELDNDEKIDSMNKPNTNEKVNPMDLAGKINNIKKMNPPIEIFDAQEKHAMFLNRMQSIHEHFQSLITDDEMREMSDLRIKYIIAKCELSTRQLRNENTILKSIYRNSTYSSNIIDNE